MSDRILYVDDEPNILNACKRSLGRKFNLTTTPSTSDALELIRTDGPYAVILSDMRMPEMDGIEFICAARELSPNTVCMMLTGNSDQETAMNAVNKGQIFRFLTKPCPQEVLATALEAGIEQYRLVTAEKELLQKTLTGSIRVLTEVLGLVNPMAFARGARIKPIVSTLVKELKLDHPWQYEIAAMLSQIGCIILPPDTIEKVYSGRELSPEDEQMFASHPHSGRKLLDHIPRMEQSARMIEMQLEGYSQIAVSDTSEADDPVALGAQIIHAATDFEALLTDGLSQQLATTKMREKTGEYNPRLLDILSEAEIPGVQETMNGTIEECTVWDLTPGMFAEEDIVTASGNLLIPKGSEITVAVIKRLKNFANGVGINEPLKVLVPKNPIDNAA